MIERWRYWRKVRKMRRVVAWAERNKVSIMTGFDCSPDGCEPTHETSTISRCSFTGMRTPIKVQGMAMMGTYRMNWNHTPIKVQGRAKR